MDGMDAANIVHAGFVPRSEMKCAERNRARGVIRGDRLRPRSRTVRFGGCRAEQNRSDPNFRLVVGRWAILTDVPVNVADGYRAKAWECLSLAESVNDPERRADLLRYARLWLSLTEPIGDLPIARSPYELPPLPHTVR